jgi:CRISPR-associated protein Cmr1
LSYLRYYRREKMTIQCQTITPMFLGNAHQEAELRSAPFKALFRYWWRVTQHGVPLNDLRKREGELFGVAGEDDGSGKSLLDLQLRPISHFQPTKVSFPGLKKVEHPECQKQKFQIDPLLYLAGMGLMRGSNPTHSYFGPNAIFEISVSYPPQYEDQINPIIALLKAFGTIGARSRNGWGSFQVLSIESKPTAKEEFEDEQKIANLLEKQTRKWTDGLQSDFPNCLGKNSSGPLLWKKADPKGTWTEAMRDLADAYIGLRARTVDSIPKLDPDRKDSPSERHLLGFPLQNHPANRARNWGNSGRHASPLRFVVHQINGKFQGFILHLPHRHSDDMPFPDGFNQQAVWEKVHKKLDGLLERATYSEVLT